MELYVILCDCSMPARLPVLYEPIDGQHVIALIDDLRPNGPVVIEQNPPENYGVAVKANRRGDRRQGYTLRCAGCGGGPDRPKASTVIAALDLWLQRVAPVAPVERVQFYEEDVPATARDEELLRDQFMADLLGDTTEGPQPRLVPKFADRRVLSWNAFRACVSNLEKDRG
ncbi:hypothetical protein [Mycolicibacterium obuense]|uniref:hypothetical protein n=1 Tax=Mycolicibacterium obuense TaxID=1807 RepID=UPI00103E6A9A|nr:hypothetical protein [Mycolicibacterium obuense]